MVEYCFDIETDGLLEELTTIHCIAMQAVDGSGAPVGDILTANSQGTGDLSIQEALKRLSEADRVVGHNIMGFDIPAVAKVYPGFSVRDAHDTRLLSTLLYPDLKDKDFNARRKAMAAKREPDLPGQLIGRHSLEAWGYRLKEWKGDYAAEMKAKGLDPWAAWNPEMEAYCQQDVVVTVKLLQLFRSKGLSPQAIELEQNLAPIVQRMHQHGWLYDQAAADALESTLMQRRAELEARLQSAVPPWQYVKRRFTPKRDNKRLGYIAGKETTVYGTRIFNPASRDHIADRLTTLYGWKPAEFTDNGKPKVDEEVLAKLKYPIIPDLLEYFVVNKRLGQLTEGNQGWSKVVRKDGRIHGSVNQNGAVTGRMTHMNPNVAQVPKVGVPYGRECRSLFTVPPGKKLVGADASGLELRCLAHFMARWDKGEYAKVILEGDIHSVNQAAAGLPTRDMAKTFIYAFLYGGGDGKIGSIVGKGAKAGGQLRKKFLAGLPALGNLVDGVKAKVANPGYLKGLDGRQLHIRSDHSALNTLLQSAGALVMKQAIVFMDETLQLRGYVPGKNYEFVGMIHDEVQIECDEGLADEIGRVAVASMTRAGQHFGFRCPIDGEYKTGDNWAETH